MSPRLKRFLSFLFIALSITAVILIAFGSNDLSNIRNAFRQMNYWWLAGIFGCWCIYTFFDGMNYWCYLRRQGFSVSIGRALNFALIGFYYSNITPSAAGGQPMQVHSMRKAGIPVGYGTMSVTIRFITNQTMISLISFVLFLLNREFVYRQLGDAVWFVRFGWVVNFSAVPVIILSAFKRSWVQKLAEWLIAGLVKIRLIRNREAVVSKVTGVLDTYHHAFHDLMHSPGQILLQFACSTVSLLGLYFTIVFVYYAFGQSGTPWYHLLTLSSLLYISASATPLPGASGAQEGGFLLYFRGIFKENIIGLALLVWRFFTFYLYLIVGVFTVLLEKLVIRRETQRKKLQNESDQPS